MTPYTPVEQIVEWWYAIPREPQWWFDRFAQILSGCFTGCMTVLLFWGASTMGAFAVCVALFAKNTNEALSMGIAWGMPLGFVTTLVGGSAALAALNLYWER